MVFKYESPLGQTAPKIYPFIAIVFTTVISALLIWQRDLRSIGTFRNAVLENPGTTSFFKQLIASLLGALWIYVASSVFNLTTRLRLAGSERTPSLQALNIWSALSAQRIDFSLPMGYMLLTLGVLLCGHGIGSVWGGAITPVLSTAGSSSNIVVPAYNSDPVWALAEYPNQGNPKDFNLSTNNTCDTVTGKNGLITTCPVPGLQSLILNSGSSATTYNSMPRMHSKNDNPTWSFYGRSYGVASAQGVIDFPDEYGGLSEYSYIEKGHMATSTCSFNSSSLFQLDSQPQVVSPTNSSLTLTIFKAAGTLPNSPDIYWEYPVVLTNQSSNAGVMTWAASGEANINQISITSYGRYGDYDKLQCTVGFQRYDFLVTVNATNQTITVEPLEEATPESFDRLGYLISNTMASLGLLPQTAASLNYDIVGEALRTNWRTYNQSVNASSLYGNGTYNPNVTISGDASPAIAAQDSFNAMIDDILLGYGAAQLYFISANDDNSTVLVNSTYVAVRLGEDSYIFATLAINIIILIIAVEELMRTRNWRNLSLFNYLDLKTVIVAASAGGKDIAEECQRRHQIGTRWMGDNTSQEVASIRVSLLPASEETDQGPMLVLAHSELSNGMVSEQEGLENGTGLSLLTKE